MKSLFQILAASALAIACSTVLPSCQSEMAVVPGNAPLVASGTGDVSYAVPRNGTIYIYDKTWNKIVYAGDVKAGQTVRLDTFAGKVLVDNQPRVEQVSLGSGSDYQFFLRPQAPPTAVERTTTIGNNGTTIQHDTVIQPAAQP